MRYVFKHFYFDPAFEIIYVSNRKNLIKDINLVAKLVGYNKHGSTDYCAH